MQVASSRRDGRVQRLRRKRCRDARVGDQREMSSSTVGSCFPAGLIVTNLTAASRAAVRFYNKRGTTEQWTKEGKQAVKMARLSCNRFRPIKCGYG